MFTAREFDKETGLYYYRARYYKPEIGRFLQVDPVGYEAGMNLYRYCSNNPWNATDPFGLDPCDPCGCGYYWCDANGTCVPDSALSPVPYGPELAPPETVPLNFGAVLTSAPEGLAETAAYETGYQGTVITGGEKKAVDGTLWILVWLCRVFRPSPAASPPKPPKPPDNCREEDGEYFDKHLQKYVTGLHHHLMRQNWDPKLGKWRINGEDPEHYPGPCPPDTKKVPSIRRGGN